MEKGEKAMSEITERVERVKVKYPMYTRNLDAATRSPLTGITLTRGAHKLAYPKKRRPCDTDVFKFTVRVSNTFIKPNKLKDMLRACGYSNYRAWVEQCIKRLEGEYAARQKGKSRSDAGTSKAAM